MCLLGVVPYPCNKLADLSPFRKESATDGTKLDLNIGETRVKGGLIQSQIYNPDSLYIIYIMYENLK